MRWIGLLALGAIGLHELRYVVGPGAHAHEGGEPRALLSAARDRARGARFVVALIDFVSTLVAANQRPGAPRRPVSGLRGPGRSRPSPWLGSSSSRSRSRARSSAATRQGCTACSDTADGPSPSSRPCSGALIAFLVRGSEKAIELLVQRTARPRPKPARVIPMRPPVTAAPRLRLLARNLAGRAPPLYVA